MALQDDYRNFLLKLDEMSNKVIYAKVTALTFSEYPIDTIEGRITSGSVNLDGNSAVRRTCSLSLVASNFNYQDYLWGLNTKFKLEIGVENTIDERYPSIVWFPQGIFILTSFNTSQTNNNFTISLSGKDKMCLLNGEIGGTLDASIDFGTIEEEDKNGVWTIRKIPIQDIIRNIVHSYGGEPYHNIIINDLNSYGLELLEYRYDTPMYLYRKHGEKRYTNLLLENDKVDLWESRDNPIELRELSIENNTLDLLTSDIKDDSNLKPIYAVSNPGTNSDKWCFTKIEYGQTAGYRMTDLTYPGDLIANAGESITSVLDKIKSMLSEFEYFYDLDGRFVFQKKQSFISTMWSPTKKDDNDDEFIDSNFALSSSTAYSFTDNKLITAFNNNPNLLNVKNDYSIWGERESVSGAKLPIHMRYAIDIKPKKYTQITVDESEVQHYNDTYKTTLKGRLESEVYTYISSDNYSVDNRNRIIYCDWREVLYQMAADYFKYNHLDNFELKVIQANTKDEDKLYVTGRTGYEQYYTDIQGFWRQLYYPGIETTYDKQVEKAEQLQKYVNALDIFLNGTVNSNGRKISGLIDKISDLAGTTSSTQKQQKASALHTYCKESKTNIANMPANINCALSEGITDAAIILSEAQAKYAYIAQEYKIYQLDLEKAVQKAESLTSDISNYYLPANLTSNDPKAYWNKDVYERPDALNYWIDFLDTEGVLNQFNVKTIGARAKVVNDTSVKAIYFRETPQVIFQECGDDYQSFGGYKIIQIPNIEEMFSISSQGKNAKDKLDELLYQHGYCNESATITALPIYYLQPNTRIYVSDTKTNLHGDYIVSKIGLSLAHGGTMSITATKAAENIL